MTTDPIMATLDAYASAYCAKDIDALMAVFDDRNDISAIGTGADELCAGHAQVRELFLRNFNEATAMRFEWDWVYPAISGDHAVVAATVIIHLEMGGTRFYVPVRWTVVMHRRTDGWVWIHRHASTAAAGQEEGQAYPHSES